GLRTVISVQGSLAMTAIAKNGSEEQKQTWLPQMAKGEVIGAFGLTEPTAGSDPSAMTTHAKLVDGEWVLNGAKRWIGLASIANRSEERRVGKERRYQRWRAQEKKKQ